MDSELRAEFVKNVINPFRQVAYVLFLCLSVVVAVPIWPVCVFRDCAEMAV